MLWSLLSLTPAPDGPLDAAAFEARLTEAIDRAFAAAYRWLGDADAARDACQEAATRAWCARNRYRAERPFYPWFYCILRNHCRDLRRRRARLTTLEEPPAVHPSLERRLVHAEEERALLRAIEALPPDLKEIIELRHFQDLSYREIAAAMGCAEGTVMSRLYRARRRLRLALTEREEG